MSNYLRVEDGKYIEYIYDVELLRDTNYMV